LYDVGAVDEAGRMPRRTAAERHLDSVPEPAPDVTSELADLLVAYHHPIRRWLTELLALEGPANVGRLAARTELAVGSVSHHLKVLHRQGLVEPAADLARDTRESWWRLCDRPFSWSVDDFEEGSLGRRVAEAAEVENFRHQVRAVRAWLQQQASDAPAWRLAAESVDSVTYATVEQLDDLGDRLTRLVTEWSAACVADKAEHPDAVRRPVRAIARAFPSAPVRP
jgi:DNA-binding transcriptional ArsR family regulator